VSSMGCGRLLVAITIAPCVVVVRPAEMPDTLRLAALL